MAQQSLYDITEVCKLLGTTSRTLRFYEGKGIITSTTTPYSSRRQYTEEQLSLIKNVLVLRTLGLSVKTIAELQTKTSDLKDAVLFTRAEIYASIESRIREIHLLNEALSALESGKNIFKDNLQLEAKVNTKEIEIARICTNAILNGTDEILYTYFSPRLAQYMPKEVYRIIRQDTFVPLGEFVSVEESKMDNPYPNQICCFVRFSKLGLKITFVFYGEKIEGLWLGYYDK